MVSMGRKSITARRKISIVHGARAAEVYATLATNKASTGNCHKNNFYLSDGKDVFNKNSINPSSILPSSNVRKILFGNYSLFF